jgi:hypothetical protein
MPALFLLADTIELGSLTPTAVADGAPAAPGPILMHWVNVQFQQVLRAFL